LLQFAINNLTILTDTIYIVSYLIKEIKRENLLRSKNEYLYAVKSIIYDIPIYKKVVEIIF